MSSLPGQSCRGGSGLATVLATLAAVLADSTADNGHAGGTCPAARLLSTQLCRTVMRAFTPVCKCSASPACPACWLALCTDCGPAGGGGAGAHRWAARPALHSAWWCCLIAVVQCPLGAGCWLVEGGKELQGGAAPQWGPAGSRVRCTGQGRPCLL